uniref:Uncharacterized protein n=1 Tax=Plectus sambesii TaxID=2011161 RepID=A0A914W9X7_9BILA
MGCNARILFASIVGDFCVSGDRRATRNDREFTLGADIRAAECYYPWGCTVIRELTSLVHMRTCIASQRQVQVFPSARWRKLCHQWQILPSHPPPFAHFLNERGYERVEERVMYAIRIYDRLCYSRNWSAAMRSWIRRFRRKYCYNDRLTISVDCR